MIKSERNDAIRKSIPSVKKPNVFVQTRGISSLPIDDQKEIWKQVREFSKFGLDNDPYNEHDFGAIETKHGKLFWKIDDYGGQDGLQLVLTIMYAEEY